MANKESATFEERVDQSALDLNDIVKLLRDISYTGETKKRSCDESAAGHRRSGAPDGIN